MLYLSATVLDRDITEKQLFLVDVKPVPRWQLLLGKWLGLTLLAGWLLLLMVSITYVVLLAFAASTRTRTLASRTYADTSDAQVVIFTVLAGSLLLIAGCVVYDTLVVRRQTLGRWTGRVLLAIWLVGIATGMGLIVRTKRIRAGGPGLPVSQLRQAHQEFLTARESFFPELPDIDEEIERYKARLKRQNRLDEDAWDAEKLRAELRKILQKKLLPIEFGAARRFVFPDLPPPGTQEMDIALRYKLHGSRGGESADWLTHAWEFHNPGARIGFQRIAQSKSGKRRSFSLPASVLAGGGDLQLHLANLSGPTKDKPGARINVPLDDGLELLVPVGSFEANLIRGALLLWIRLAMLAAVGIAASTFLSGSVAAFFVLGVLAMGLSNSFVYKTVAPDPTSFVDIPKPDNPDATALERTGDWLQERAKTVLPVLLTALPDFDETDPVPDLTLGREIPLGRVLRQALFDLGLRAGALVAIGLVAFYRREIGLPVIT
jgi:hypothetical protein